MVADQARIVEFVGLPGAGKTTTVRLLAERLTSDDAKTVIVRDIRGDISKLPALRRIGAGVLSGRSIWGSACHGIFCPLSSKWPSRLRGPFQVADYFIGLEQERRRADQGDIIMLENWIVQCLWRACCHGVCRIPRAMDLIKHHAEHFEVSYIFVDTDPEVAAGRIQRRAEERKTIGLEVGITSYEKYDMEQCIYLLKERRNLFIEIIALLRNNNIKTLTVDGACATEHVSETIRAAMTTWYAWNSQNGVVAAAGEGQGKDEVASRYVPEERGWRRAPGGRPASPSGLAGS